MFCELSGNMDINVSHDLSRRMSIRRHENVRDLNSDDNITSKIEMSFNNIKGIIK